MADIARGTHLPIATGERIFTKWAFAKSWKRRCQHSSARSLLRRWHHGDSWSLPAWQKPITPSCPHTPWGPSLAAGIQVAASVPNFLCQEQVSLGEGYIKEPFKVEEGYVKVPTKPGLGIELDEDAMQDKLGHDWRNPEPYDSRDGSVVDW